MWPTFHRRRLKHHLSGNRCSVTQLYAPLLQCEFDNLVLAISDLLSTPGGCLANAFCTIRLEFA